MTLGNDNGTDGQTDGQTECDAICGPLLGRRRRAAFTWRHLANYNDTHVLFGTH